MLIHPVLLFILIFISSAQANITFEKLTNRDYSGFTYYTIRNVSLYECLGWCREELECSAAAFSFIVNPLAPVQDTACKLLNDTVSEVLVNIPTDSNVINVGNQELVKNFSGNKGTNSQLSSKEDGMVSISLQPQKAANMYFFNKIKLESDSTCNRLWSFERYPNKILRGIDGGVTIYKNNKDSCLSACQTETKFVCRSVEYNYLTNQCHISQFDRRTLSIVSPQELIDQEGVDYFENSCIDSNKVCSSQRDYDFVKIGVPLNKVSYYVEINYYPDKELLVKSQAGCIRACTIENEFICRSILYRANYKPGQPNCALYHLDHYTLPDGLDTFSVQFNIPLPLFDTGDGTDAVYLEATCSNTTNSLLNNGFTQNLQVSQNPMSPVAMSSIGRPTIVSVPTTSTIPPTKTSTFMKQQTTTQYQDQVHQTQQSHQHKNIVHSNHMDNILKSNSIPILTTTSLNNLNSMSTNSLMSNSKIHQHLQSNLPPSKTNSIKGSSNLSLTQQTTGTGTLNLAHNITIGTTTDPSCDSYGVCYQVSLRCTDTRILVQVKTSQPFHGRIYALGRSETCNNKIHNSQHFNLEMPLTGQQCNTQNVQGVYSNTVVLQHHNVVLTKADKVYHVRCTYETTSRNISFGMVPVKDAVMGSGFGTEAVEVSASPEAPLPRIVIENGDAREASTVRVGDKLTFRIAIPDNTPYGIFARSCIAMAKDARSTFEIIDENGCPVDNSIFPAFQLNGNALESTYEAFRFTESYGVIFQCNVKYCIGRCEPIICPSSQINQGIFGRDSNNISSYGRRRRNVDEYDNFEEVNATNKTTASYKNRSIENKKINHSNVKGRRMARNKSKSEETNVNKVLKNDEMTLSHEILVLDLNDSEPQKSDWEYNTLNAKEMMLNMDHCASTTTLMALCVISGLLLVLYVCTVAYFTSQQRNYQNRCKSFY